MKVSVIVPVYNVENYLVKCLDSLVNQTYKNVEIIVVNDGSPDNSQAIINDYQEKYENVIGLVKENGGLSDARNYGVEHVSGEYIMFLDSDDSFDVELIEKVVDEINNNHPDIVKYGYRTVNEKTNEIIEKGNLTLNQINGELFYTKYIDSKYLFEMAWLYAYQTKYYKQKYLSFKKGKIHEDFEMTPKAIIQAKNISSVDFNGYNYLIRENTITSTTNREKVKKAAYDVLDHYDSLSIFSNTIKDLNCKRYLKSYIANAAIESGSKLDDDDLEEYIKVLKKKNVVNNLLDDTLKRKLKIKYIKLFMKKYIKEQA